MVSSCSGTSGRAVNAALAKVRQLTNSQPASRRPCSTIASAICTIFVSFMSAPKAYHDDQPCSNRQQPDEERTDQQAVKTSALRRVAGRGARAAARTIGGVRARPSSRA